MGPSTIAPATSKDDKENRPLSSGLAGAVAHLTLDGGSSPQKHSVQPSLAAGDENCTTLENSIHQAFMDQALDMARLALKTNETPVGCVLVHNDTVIAKGMNATNITRNGTRHAEFMALTALLSYRTDAAAAECHDLVPTTYSQSSADTASVDSREPSSLDNELAKKGHLYPYGQKLHPSPRVDRSIVRDCVLYVTVEPCVMCASLLRQLGIRKVYFGAVNDKFGGAGGVFSIHMNSAPTGHWSTHQQPLQASTNAVSNIPRPIAGQTLHNVTTNQGSGLPGGDGGNIEGGFEVEGGWGRDEAVGLLRRFYVQENGRAPVPRKKEGRAARLAAMENDSNGLDAVPPVTYAEDVNGVDETLPNNN